LHHRGGRGILNDRRRWGLNDNRPARTTGRRGHRQSDRTQLKRSNRDRWFIRTQGGCCFHRAMDGIPRQMFPLGRRLSAPLCRKLSVHCGARKCVQTCESNGADYSTPSPVHDTTWMRPAPTPNNPRRSATTCLQAASAAVPKRLPSVAARPNDRPSIDIGCSSTSSNPAPKRDSRKDAARAPLAGAPAEIASRQLNFHPLDWAARRPLGVEKVRNTPLQQGWRKLEEQVEVPRRQPTTVQRHNRQAIRSRHKRREVRATASGRRPHEQKYSFSYPVADSR
jgi:hypothetical protein